MTDKIVRTTVEENDKTIIKKQVMNRTDDMLIRHQVMGIDDGPDITIESLTVTENGTYTAPENKAYSPVTVNVPIPSTRIVSEYDFTTESLEDKIRKNVYAVTNRGDVPTTDGILIDHNFDGVYPNYSLQQVKDYIIEVSIGNWTIQPPTSTYNRKLLGLEYRSYTGSASTNGLATGYYPILYYDRTLDTPVWTVNNQTAEDYFANKTVYIKLVNYYDTTALKIQIKVYYSEDGETYTDTGIVVSNTNCFYGVVVGTEVTKTNTDASAIKDFYLKKLKITEIDTNIVIGGN